jgi:acetoin:2,6-dichlorophenolindophenol oxidoreductase subunit alpha
MSFSSEDLLKSYRSLVLIRRVELKIEGLYPQDEMKVPVHLSLGQEAAAVGVCAHLRPEDYVFSNHRGHAHYLAKGGDLNAMMAELFCKETGCARGRGGSMHLADLAAGLPGASAIVGGSIPHAVGAAFAAKYLKKEFVAVSFFGDAAVEEGVFFESLNLAMLKKVPVVFVCENNFYAVCSPLTSRQPNVDLAMRARAFDMPSAAVNGSDFFDVYERAGKAIAHARSGKGPYFLEIKVQRWRQHVGTGDPGREQYRRRTDIDEIDRLDPLRAFRELLISQFQITADQLSDIEADVNKNIEAALQFAKDSPLPKKEDLEQYVFFKK